ncbi:unnamed protein product [Dibothriocephalus latus]|uniref:Uncharacterized protein n=1 Tax=Dibothriocephalus latus TaxID=60516 RepID=A0A3P7LTN7_DIBLA|nr:unnamed protein product [Dibothriocephalus latus]
MDHSYLPAVVNLTDADHSDLGIMCVFELQPDSPREVIPSRTYFLVDIRDVQLNSSDDWRIIDLVNKKRTDAIAKFSSAFAAASAIGVVTTEDSTGMYRFLAVGNISLVMAVTSNVSYIVSPLIPTSEVRFAVAATSTLDNILSKVLSEPP